MTQRYAIYLILPAQEPLHRLASNWLGYDIHNRYNSNKRCQHDSLRLLNEHQSFTKNASSYGFHATLKPPFRLIQGTSEKQLRKSFNLFANRYRTFECSALKLSQMGQFLVLMPSIACNKLNELASDCVRSFEPFRAELSEQEIFRRKPETLSEKQQALLHQWGYPYVMDEFKFHMTLSDALAATDMTIIKPLLQEYLQPCLKQPFKIEQISLVRQPQADENFEILKTVKFSRF